LIYNEQESLKPANPRRRAKLKRTFPPSSWYQQQARHKSRPHVFEEEACAARHQQRWRAIQDKFRTYT
jgi:hypothetical protein